MDGAHRVTKDVFSMSQDALRAAKNRYSCRGHLGHVYYARQSHPKHLLNGGVDMIEVWSLH